MPHFVIDFFNSLFIYIPFVEILGAIQVTADRNVVAKSSVKSENIALFADISLFGSVPIISTVTSLQSAGDLLLSFPGSVTNRKEKRSQENLPSLHRFSRGDCFDFFCDGNLNCFILNS